MTLTKIHQIIAIIAGFLSIIGIGGLSTYFGWPIPSLLLYNKHTISHISTNPRFSIESIKTKNKIVINPGDSFSYKFGIPLSARGTTSLLDDEMVWIIIVDQTGSLYLQHPPVTIRSGDWVVTNIRPLEGIKRIIFARVDAGGNRFFLRKVEHDEWGKFKSMPSGTTEIAYVQLD